MSSISATTRPQMGKLVNPCIPRGYARNEESLKLSPSTLSGRVDTYLLFFPVATFQGVEKCLHQSCHIWSNYMPKLQGNLLATESFFHTSKFFGLPPKSFLSNLIIAGQQFCEEDWGNLKKKYHSLEEEDLLHYCFSSAYIVALLHDSLGISLDDDRIGYANQVQDIPLDWALGAFIMQSAAEIEFEHSRLLGSAVDGNITSLLNYLSGCCHPWLRVVAVLEKIVDIAVIYELVFWNCLDFVYRVKPYPINIVGIASIFLSSQSLFFIYRIKLYFSFFTKF
ncbi:nucleotide phosphatase [Lithospermum erythrorhizon]|uniref:Nucleotide phosphatase n=1 Tax=Lithospermum erythrorhizon TaxID=34254 RepID=A0AAV3PMY5_LITER